MRRRFGGRMKRSTSNIIAVVSTTEVVIAAIAVAAFGLHLMLRFGVETTGTVFGVPSQAIPLLVALTSGIPLVMGLVMRLARLEFSADPVCLIRLPPPSNPATRD